MSAPLAHAGHWAVGLIYLAPVLVLAVALAVASWRDRRREGSEQEEESRA